jgi:hypothetical protein
LIKLAPVVSGLVPDESLMDKKHKSIIFQNTKQALKIFTARPREEVKVIYNNGLTTS